MEASAVAVMFFLVLLHGPMPGHAGMPADSAKEGAAAAAPVNLASTPVAKPTPLHASVVKNRRMLQDCYNSPDYIQCNSETLCAAIGWSSPAADWGTECDCITMCDIAEANGGTCEKQWNDPTSSTYYSIIYDGAVYCDPSRGGGGPKGGR